MIGHHRDPAVLAVQNPAVMTADGMQLASLCVGIIAGQSQQLGIVIPDFRCGAVVLHHDDLVVAPGAVLLNRSNTSLQIFHVILVGDHDGDLRISQNLIADPENCGTGSGTGDLKMFESMLFQMIRHGTLCRFDGIGLCVNTGGGTARMASPVIHQSGHMYDLLCSVRQTQDHIVVLRTVKSRTEQFLAFQKFSGKDAEMTDIIVGPQIIRCIIRLKMHGQHFINIVLLEGGLITVQIIRTLFIDFLHIGIQYGRMQNVILIEQSDIVSGGQLVTLIGVVGNTSVMVQVLIYNTAI